MHQHNPDLIMALAAGELSSSDASSASSEIAACVECSADLDAQRIALAALATVPSARMTESERLHLHATLRDQLGLVEEPRAERTDVVTRRRRLWSAPWALGGAAAVLIAVIAVAPGLNLISAGNDEGGDFTASAATTTTIQDAADGRIELSPSGVQESSPGLDQITDDTATPTTAAAAAEVTTTAAAAVDRLALGTEPPADLDQILLYTTRAGGDPELSRELNAKGFPMTTGLIDASGCEPPAETQVPSSATGFVVAAILIDGETIPVIAYVPPDVDDTVLVVFDPATCAVLYRTPPLD